MEKEIINLGVQFRDERTRVSFEDAEEILLSDRVQTIAEAEAEDEGIVLRCQYYICPDCGKEIPAFRSAFEKIEYVCPYGEDEIREFCSGQISLFRKKKILLFNTKIPLGPGRYCPCCRTAISAPEEKDQVILSREEGKITVTRRMSVPELWQMVHTGSIEIRDALHLSETVTFDLTEGETSLVVKAGEDVLYEETDPADAVLETDPLCRIIKNERYLTDRITSCFADYFPEGLPYEREEINFHKLRLMTMFTGFNREFYEGIPMEYDTGRPAAEFGAFFGKIRRIEEIPAYLTEKKVPKAKRLRKLLFEKQSLLFYADEICYLWKLLANADRTMQFLKICGTEFLPCLKIYPGSKKFLEDYGAAMGTEALSELFLAKPYCAIQYGIYYATGSEERRAKERSQFNRSMADCFSGYGLEAYEGYTGIPVPWNVSFGTEDRTPYACDGFLFRRITSSGGLRKAGKELSNCLAGYGGNSYIVGIHRRGRYVAALEIRTEENGKRTVSQAYEAHNKEINKESRLGKAVQNFMEQYDLVYADDEE